MNVHSVAHSRASVEQPLPTRLAGAESFSCASAASGIGSSRRRVRLMQTGTHSIKLHHRLARRSTARLSRTSRVLSRRMSSSSRGTPQKAEARCCSDRVGLLCVVEVLNHECARGVAPHAARHGSGGSHQRRGGPDCSACAQLKRLELVSESRGRSLAEAKAAVQAAEQAAAKHAAEADALRRQMSATEARRLGDRGGARRTRVLRPRQSRRRSVSAP